MTFLRKLFAKRQGYTIDQTILIIAIIAILITLIILTIAWALINRSSGTRLGSQLNQMEDAIGQFYATHHLWPHQAYTSSKDSTYNAYVLVGDPAFPTSWVSTINTADLKNQVKGFKADSTAHRLYHNAGNSSDPRVRIEAGFMPSSVGAGVVSQHMIIQFLAVPISDAQEADKAIDGSDTPTTGRLVYATNNCLPASSGATAAAPTAPTTQKTVYVCYVANAI